jgi:hypothetical protein
VKKLQLEGHLKEGPSFPWMEDPACQILVEGHLTEDLSFPWMKELACQILVDQSEGREEYQLVGHFEILDEEAFLHLEVQ